MPAAVEWDEKVKMLGGHSPISKSVRKKPAAVIECESDDVEIVVEADSSPKTKNQQHEDTR